MLFYLTWPTLRTWAQAGMENSALPINHLYYIYIYNTWPVALGFDIQVAAWIRARLGADDDSIPQPPPNLL